MTPEGVIRNAWERRGKWPKGAEVYWVPARPPMTLTSWPEDHATDRIIPKEERAVEFRRERFADPQQGIRVERLIGKWGGAEVVLQEHISPLPLSPQC